MTHSPCRRACRSPWKQMPLLLIQLVVVGSFYFHACWSLSTQPNNNQQQSNRRRGFPLRRITGDGTPYEFPCQEVPFRQEWPDDRWPFSKNDFGRLDYYNDGIFYFLPRLVYHVDEPAVCALTQHYRRSIPPNSDLLDICSSWVSHYPNEFPETMRSIKATGMNPLELLCNDQITDGYVVADLNGSGITNKPPSDGGNSSEGTELLQEFEDASVDVITCALSIDYLINPVQVLRGCYRVLKPGGKVIVSFSNRCFGLKAIRVWMKNKSKFHLELVNAFFQYADSNYETKAYDITPIVPDKKDEYRDPLFVVEATKQK